MNNIRQHRPTQAAPTSNEGAPQGLLETPSAESSTLTAPPLKRAPRRGDDLDYLGFLLLEFKL
jgi:hypothetical protein